jgi:hypothetical protein
MSLRLKDRMNSIAKSNLLNGLRISNCTDSIWKLLVEYKLENVKMQSIFNLKNKFEFSQV